MMKLNEWPRFCTCKAILGQEQPIEMNFVMNHAPGAESIARPVDTVQCSTTVKKRTHGRNNNHEYHKSESVPWMPLK